MSAKTREDVNAEILSALNEGRPKNFRKWDLRGADLSHANLAGADFWSANLDGANLRYANLTHASLTYADLHGVDLSGADLSWVHASDAELWKARLSDAALHRATLPGDFALSLVGLESGWAVLYPTPDQGWQMQIGCWSGTVDKLERMIAGNTGWPDAYGSMCDRRRPGLQAWIALARDYMKRNAKDLELLAKHWEGR